MTNSNSKITFFKIFKKKCIKAAKLILKRSKKNPFLYTKEDIRYAKKIKKQLKKDALSHQETQSS